MTISLKERVQQLIAKIEAIEEIVTDEDHPNLPKPFVIRCTVKRYMAWDRSKIENAFHVTLPDDLVELWNQSSGVELYKEINYGASALVIWSPDEVIEKHLYSVSWMDEERFFKGDLIIGEFREHDDLILLRCDSERDDFGHVIITRALDPRTSWPFADTSLVTFLEKASKSMNYDYWAGPNGW